jgi:divalent metal cation (Fe/Co/Zn/Cd) transporter
LKTRKSGAEKLIEFTLIMRGEMTLTEVHQICDEIEDDLKIKISNTFITIHTEPCNNND